MESKELSYILRHHPEEYGLTPDEFGYVKVNELLKNCKISFEDLCDIVYNNTRFYFNDDCTLIRAAHGHSYPVLPIEQQATPPSILYHGTAKNTYESFIKSQGIKKMNRSYVHLSDNYDKAKVVGARHGKPVVLSIDAQAMCKEGYKFYKSEDGVWLTTDINPKFILEVL